MSYNAIRRPAGVLTALAAALAAFATAPAHADITGNGLTISGNSFQTGSTLDLTFQAPEFGSGPYVVMDTYNGITGTADTWGSWYGNTTVPAWDLSWVPQTPGQHQLYVTTAPGAGTPAPVYGPITVNVTGTSPYSNLPAECGQTGVCLYVQGTPEVGCTLTIDTPSTFQFPASMPGSAVLDNYVRNQSNVGVFDNGGQIGTTTPNTGATTVTWTPTVAGTHHLTSTANEVSIPTQTFYFLGGPTPPYGNWPAGSSTPISAGGPTNDPVDNGGMYLPIAAAGTSSCAPVTPIPATR